MVLSVFGQEKSLPKARKLTQSEVQVGAARLAEYLPLIEGKTVAIVANQTSEIQGTHLVDTLLSKGIQIAKVFAPEHGFRGTADAGEKIADSRDPTTGLTIRSLYGANKRPKASDLKGIDVVLFDIQDVGVRFYTYIYTMTYVMEACAENGVQVIVLDRPNPNGFYVDGPVLKRENASFVGLHPIPLVHGMTVGEYAQMLNGEGWLRNGVRCDLQVIACAGYTHSDHYQLPVKPSPNLPNMASVYLYPSLGLFEGTVVSVGRGTDYPFQVFGHPQLLEADFSFTPESKPGAKYPPHKGVLCKGYDLREFGENQMTRYKGFYLFWLLTAYRDSENQASFFLKNGFFHKLSGDQQLMEQVKNGKSEKEIRASWQNELDQFKKLRKSYLLYPDFE
ncbi:MAG: exo-beta-N-acetylmuramidase NamZ domain-containing protein [Salibacteraceae bacterium]